MKTKKPRVYKQYAKTASFDLHLKQLLKDDEFRKGFEREGLKLEVALMLLRLRKKKKMTQRMFAEKIGTSQSVVARIESGSENLSLARIRKIAGAFGKRVRLTLV